MKSWLLYVFVAAMILPVSCKKGDNDPILSLRTRKNRLTGTWNVESYEFTSTFGDVRAIRYDLDDGLTYSLEDSSSYSRGFTWELSFEGDGLYTSRKKEDFPLDSITEDEAYSLNSLEKGVWEFTGGNESPSKSKLVLFAEEISSTRTDQGSNIDRLTNKELWLKYEVTQTSAFEENVETLELKFVKAD